MISVYSREKGVVMEKKIFYDLEAAGAEFEYAIQNVMTTLDKTVLEKNADFRELYWMLERELDAGCELVKQITDIAVRKLVQNPSVNNIALEEKTNLLRGHSERIRDAAKRILFRQEMLFSDSSFSEGDPLQDALRMYKASADKLYHACWRVLEWLLPTSANSAAHSAEQLSLGRVPRDCGEEMEAPILLRSASQSTECPMARPLPARVEAMHMPAPCQSASAIPASKKKAGFFSWLKSPGKEQKKVLREEPVPPPQVDSVQFSAVAPGKIVPGKYLPVNIVMYEETMRHAVDSVLRSLGENGKEMKSGYHDVQQDSVIRVCLTSQDVTITDGEEERVWKGKYLDFSFAVKIPQDYAQEQLLLTASVYINDIIATRLKLIVDCDRKRKKEVKITREDVASAFVSYASQDRSRVAAIIQGMKKARPDMDIFFDIESLRSGQRWEDALKDEIRARDVLFLCWSQHARESRWVDMEWRYALENKGEDAIEPIPIDPPDICPPPIELQQKHFHDRMLYIIQSVGPTVSGMLSLRRVKTSEIFPLERPVTCVGKDRSTADVWLGDNASISRNHARILHRENGWFIVDTNSTNHTYVDGKMIPTNTEVPIGSGTRIRLANEEFEVT